MTKTTVVNLARGDKCDVYVGRPSKWGNPYKIGVHGNRRRCVILYEAWVKKQPALMAALPELKGKVLGCWCSPLPCHADVLARLADAMLGVVDATSPEGRALARDIIRRNRKALDALARNDRGSE